MIQNATEFKFAIAATVAALTALWGWMGWVVVIYGVVMVMDYITGSMVAAKNKEWTSKEARDGIWHKAGSIIAVVVSGLADIVVGLIINNIASISTGFEYTVLICPIVLIWYILTELGSIVENADKMGAPVPSFLKNFIKSIGEEVETAGEKMIPK